MAVRTITTRLAIDGETEFKRAMTSVNTSLREIRSELELSEAQFRGQANSIDALTAKDKLLREEIAQQTVKVRALEQAMKDAAQVYGDSSTQADKYRAQLNRAKTELENMNQALTQNTRYMKEARESSSGTASSIDGLGKAVQGSGNNLMALASALQSAGVGMAAKEIAEVLEGCVESSMAFETALAGVNKVAKLSDADLAALGEDIKALSTEIPATTGEIAQVAEAAARLGIAQKDLMSFTEVMLQLGNVSNLSADEAATALARFANIAGTSAEDYERLGSTIVALGNNFATSEAEITAMASRLAAAGELAGLSEAQIMALAAAMSSVGIEAEAGGTAMTQTLTAMEKAVTEGGEKLEQFAQVAGMSSGAFAQAWQSEPIAAIQAFITGLGGLDEAGESATEALDALGLSGVRQSNMLKSLGLASETLTETVRTAEEAWRDNTELAETAAAMYDTTQTKMQLAANAAENLKIAVGDALSPALAELAEGGTYILGGITELLERCPELTVALTAFFGVFAAGAVGLGAYTAVTTAAAAASGALATAMNLIPGVAVAAGIVAVAAALHSLWMRCRDAKEAVDDLSEAAETGAESAAREAGAASQAADAAKESASAAKEQTRALEDAAEAAKTAAQEEEEAAKSAKELQKSSQDLSKAVDTLSKALKEQSENGSLNLETAQKLIEAGYSAALSIDTETGAVVLDKAAYIDLAAAKLNDQIASLEVQKASVENAEKLRVEAEAASHAGSAYWEAAVARAAMEKGDTTALDAQIAALVKTREALQNYTGAAGAASRASSRAKTAAQRDLEAYKDLAAELDHRKALELISEQEYYLKLKEYRDQYLTDEGNISEYRRVTEQIYKYDKTLADDEAALWSQQTETLVDELEDRVRGIESQRQGMERALSGYGELFTVKDDQMSLESIQKQIDAIDRYEEAMTGLRERGLSQDLLDEVLAMNVDEATEYGQKLLQMSDSQWEQYNQLWNEKQLRAAQVAEQFYKDQLEELETEYDAKLGEALDGLTDTAFQSGADTAQGLIDGLASKEEALYAKARAIEQEGARIWEGAWKNIPSNAEIAATLNAEALRETPAASAQDVSSAMTAGVNGMQTAMEGRPVYVQVESTLNVDSKRFYTETLYARRAVDRANPEKLGDT